MKNLTINCKGIEISNDKTICLIAGPCQIETEQHALDMAGKINEVAKKYNIGFVYKTSFDKANRTSLQGKRGAGLDRSLPIFDKIKKELNISILTDIHNEDQCSVVSNHVDILQIPAFLCRQTDLLKASAKTGLPIHVKKGQCFSADVMHKCKEKLLEFGAKKVILCERGSMYGYQDLIVDPRNLIWLKSDTNDVSMDITHCLQQPAKKMADGTVKAGGIRDMIPYMGKMAIALGVDVIFMEVHDNPDKALCDGPTQWPLDRLKWLLDFLEIKKN